MNLSVYQAIIAAPFAHIGLCMAGDAVSALDYLPADTPEQPPADVATARVVEQLQAYFRDPHAPFTVPLAVTGTAFQQQVWTALQAIPPGTVLTYGELAQQLGSAARAIGGACRANHVPILIPCHRIVAQHGLGGYAGAVTGDPLAIKRWLLQHERISLLSPV
ncbi:MAG: methylated-DNA-[protein]-cysteine S-methyltransferase [Pseudomonadota bacterium]|nr:methylated-DNA-[protein]-cysteine S-methyltransferase [Pseudomonadota bacterium]